jgi:hypothetical protein
LQGLKDVFMDAYDNKNIAVMDNLIYELFVKENYNNFDYIVGLKKQIRDLVYYYYKNKI